MAEMPDYEPATCGEDCQDDEDGFAWDFDRYGSFCDDDDDEDDEE